MCGHLTLINVETSTKVGKYKLAKLTQEEVENMKSPITLEEI